MFRKTPRIALIGGGTGSFTLLQGLKKLTPYLTAIVNMSDDGGSTGILRDELGVLPPGDIRQCLVALSDSLEVRNLFNYRFGEGRLEGQSLGNIILSGLELQHNNFGKAISVASDILHITGKVVPVTLDKYTLVLQDGAETIHGEFKIGDHHISHDNTIVRLEPSAMINPEAKEAIKHADMIVIAPGDVYRSLLPILAVDGVAEAMANTKALIVSVTNLVTLPGQTDGWHVVDFIKEFEKYLGEGRIDTVLYNTAPISDELLKKYASEGEFPVAFSESRFSEIQADSVGASLVARSLAAQDPNDKIIRRTLIRHDARRVCRQLIKLTATKSRALS